LLINPLVQVSASIGSRGVLPGLFISFSLIILAVLIGRFFCGFFCPLGLLIELFSLLKRPVLKLNPAIKYYHLLLILILSVLGVYSGIFDPIVSLTRAVGALKTGGSITLIIILIILYLSLFQNRFFCRYLCPLGGFFGLVSRISLFKLRITECRSCLRCEKVCPTGAIKDKTIIWEECIVCLECIDICPDHAINLEFGPAQAKVDISRRDLILTGLTALLVLPFFRFRRPPVLRPPGSIPEDDFLRRCVRCGGCINVCPTHGLQFDLFTYLSPKLVPRIGGCERYCTSCGQVCPTGAIRNLPLSEKEYARIGTAIIDRNRCLAWRDNRSCLVCDEACPYGAVYFKLREIDGKVMGRPIVDQALCIGCGLCESRCPLAGPSAIVVYPEGEERKDVGGYRTEEKVRLRMKAIEAKEEIPEGFIR